MSSIVIYFSRTGENYFGGELKNIEKGNTEVIAEYIQELDNADLFKVEPAVEYPIWYCIHRFSKLVGNIANAYVYPIGTIGFWRENS